MIIYLKCFGLLGIVILAISGVGWMKTHSPSDASPSSVELAYFSATRISQDMVLLQWESSLEINHQAYIIERSAEGGTFSTIAQIGGAVNSSRAMNYHYADPYQGARAMYRLKHVSGNGTISYSEPTAIQSGVNQVSVQDLKVFPQVFQDKVHITFSNQKAGTYSFNLFSHEGASVFEQAFDTSPGLTTFVFEDTLQLPKGTYIAALENAEGFLRVIELVKE